MDHNLSPIIKKLESLFSIFNDHLFNGELEMPVITIASSKRNALGWCTCNRVWTKGRPLEPKDLEGKSDGEIKEMIEKRRYL